MKHIVFAGAMLFAAGASAQEFRATLTGRVTDASGATIPRAAVVVTNTSTGTIVRLATDKSGEYTAPFLLPGTYSLGVSAPGFSSYLHDGITLLTGQKVQEDAQLAVGAGTEEVRVTADAPLVDATTASVAQVLTAEEIEDLPSNGRSPLGLAKTELGVVPKAKNSVVQNRPFDNGAASDFSIGGGNSQSNEYLLNGVPNMQDSSRLPGFSPQLDSVDAIRVDVFSSDASLGDTSGGTVNLTTKGGTNVYHGTVSEFNQFSAINAPQRWFVPSNNKTPVTRSNQYGATLGGPVVIPHLFNGRDRLFFFYSFERYKDSVPNAVTTTVPTVAERGGDFSALLALPKGTSYQLYDPYTAVATTTSSGTVTIARSPLLNNKIDPSRFNPVAKAYLQFFPLPNLPGAADGENNFFSNVPTVDDYNSHAGRLDYSVNPSNKIFFETHRSEYYRILGNVFSNLSTGTTTYNVYQGGLLDYIHTFTPTSTIDVRASLTRAYSNTSLQSQGFDATSLGFPNYVNTQATEQILPRIVFSETGVAYNSLSTTAGTVSAFDTYQIFSAFTKVSGHHTLKIGPDLRLEKYAKLTPGSPSGAFTFGQTFVQSGTSATAIPFGGSFASFLFGIPTAGTQTIGTPALYNAGYFAGFLQDDWRIRPSLTLNFGLRVEHETPIVESGNRAVVGFDPNATNSTTAAASAKYASSYSALSNLLPVAQFSSTGGIIYASDAHRNEYNTAPVYISPRFGFAFAPPGLHEKTAIRGGFGIFVNPFNDYNTPQSYGYSATTALVPTTNAYLTPAATLSDPFPAINPIQQVVGSSLGVNTNLGAGVQFRGPNLRVPYSERWSLDVQQQLARNIMLDVGYIGAHQVHLSYSNSISSVGDYPYLSTSRRADPNVPVAQYNTATNPCGVTPTQKLQCNVTNPFYGLPNVTGTLATNTKVSNYSLLQTFPEYSGVVQALVPGASATYNELLARLEFHNAHGLLFNANYEYSRNLITGQLTPGGPLSYQDSTSDYPHHFSFEGSYALPLGRGQRFFNNNHLVAQLLGGFKMNAIYQFLSGTPISWGSVDFANGTNGFQQDFQSHPRDFTHAFNTAAFYQGTGTGYANCYAAKPTGACDMTDTGQPSGTYNIRTFPQYFLRTDFTNNLDASIIKSFTAGERIRIEYRFEAFNVLNHTQFGTPFVSPSASTFGTINTIASVNRTLQQGLRVSF